jgi:hypothetical protein
MVHAVDPTARRGEPDSFKNVVPSAHVRMALLPEVHVLIHVLIHVLVHAPVHVPVHFRALNRISGIRRNDPRCDAPSLSAKNWPTNREGFRPPR